MWSEDGDLNDFKWSKRNFIYDTGIYDSGICPWSPKWESAWQYQIKTV